MKRSFFAMLMCSLAIAYGGNDPTTAYAQDVEVGFEATSEATREDEWRAEFLARVEKVDNISQRKEELTRKYILLSHNHRHWWKKFKEKESEKRSLLKANAMRYFSLRLDRITSQKRYLVRRYKLILNKEQLNTSFDNQELSESEFWEKTKEIDRTLFRLEYLQTIDNIAFENQSVMERVSSDISQIAFWVR